MSKYKVKVITGYDKEQHYTIDAEEAHKAYHLFLHPEKRGVFNNGVALIGKNISSIQPDYHATMGWNTTHKLDNDDWNELRMKHIEVNIKTMLAEAKDIARDMDNKPELASMKLTTIINARKKENLPFRNEVKSLAEGMSI